MELPFEPPVETSEQLAFACMALAERFIGGLTEIGLVGTALRIELTDDTGARYERVWLHPDRFTAADTVNRIRWQADALPRVAERGGSGIARVRLSPRIPIASPPMSLVCGTPARTSACITTSAAPRAGSGAPGSARWS
ncbi:hypothetical protein [Leucobacter soli]|uniref:hypothetical protein n=1 Tax=Leucobacter soli TaxID=2812850 RepID=UPI0036084C4D